MQPWIPKCPAVFLFAGNPSRFRPGPTAETNTFWESGAASQALLLTVVANGLGATPANGLDLSAIHAAAGLPAAEKLTVIIPVGRIAK
jgi:nitroreductase